MRCTLINPLAPLLSTLLLPSPGHVLMQAMVNGKERTRQQWQQMFEQTGFSIKEIVETPSMAAIVAVPS